MYKRLFLVFTGCLLIMGILSCNILAADNDPIEKYPHTEVKIICAYSVGGSTDLISRTLAEGMSEYLGTNIFVANVTGGAGSIGNVALVQSRPDGRTIGTIASGAGIASPLKEMPYEIAKDLVFINLGWEFTAVVWVNADSEFYTFDDIAKYGQENPGKFVLAAEEATGLNPIAFNVLSKIAGPFEYSLLVTEGSAESARLVSIGEADATSITAAGAMKFYEEGMLRPILVNSSKPVPRIPEDVPLAPDVYPEYTPINSAGGFVAPAGFPEEERQMLENAVLWTIENPKYQKKLEEIGAIINFMPGEEALKYFESVYQISLDYVTEKGLLK